MGAAPLTSRHSPLATHLSPLTSRLSPLASHLLPLAVIDQSRKELVASGLEQSQISCTRDEKDVFLLLLLRTRLATGRVIIFTNAVTALVRLRSVLAMLSVPGIIALQGNMQQRARLKALDRFKSSRAGVLLATDVAARGLDITGVDFVVHYQLPRSAEVYVHRSGRTARAGTRGLSIALVEPSDTKGHRRLCHELGETDGLPELPIESRLLPKVREVVSIARQLDKAAHVQAKRAQEETTRKRLAVEMGMDFDTDEEEGNDGDVARRQELMRKNETERLKAKLKHLLGRIERPTGMPVHKVAKSGATWA